MVICKEIDYYLKYAEEHPKWINKKRKLLIENIVKPTLKRNDVFFDEKTYQSSSSRKDVEMVKMDSSCRW